MNSTTCATDFLEALTLRPVEGQRSTSIIHTKMLRNRRAASRNGRSRSSEMTDADWDKFEKDIADAFEQIP
jgi:hypothetical protein